VLMPPSFAVSSDKFLFLVLIAAAVLLIVCLQDVYSQLKSYDESLPSKDRDARMRRHSQVYRLTLQGLALISVGLAIVGLYTNLAESVYMVLIFEVLATILYYVYWSKANQYMAS
jgi:hypothetical protein